MKILNLVYPEKSDVKFKVSRFPDGQQQVTITDLESVKIPLWTVSNPIGPYFQKEGPKKVDNVEIKSRLNNFLDLELIICAVKSLRALKVKTIYLNTPYFLGSRSDIKFEDGSNNYIKDVISPIINGLQFENVMIMDGHSIALENCIKNYFPIDNLRLVNWALGMMNHAKDKNIVLISPDAGANKKIYKIAEQISYYDDIVTCTKIRDVKNGKITTTKVPINFDEHGGKDFVIIDDICDGGATFINIAKAIREKTSCGKIYLIVTHGIFSKGLKELSQYFDGIYSTNSYRDVEMLDEDYLFNLNGPFLKQLNIF